MEVTDEQAKEKGTQLIKRYKWQRVEAGQIAERVHTYLETEKWLQELMPKKGFQQITLETLCLWAASALIYQDCIRALQNLDQRASLDLKRRAFGNVLSFLEQKVPQVLRNVSKDEQIDALQFAVTEMYTNIADCEDPRTFLAWGVTLLRISDKSRRRYQFRQRTVTSKLQAAQLTGVSPILPSRRIRAPGDEEVYAMLGTCLSEDNYRIIAMGAVGGLHRRDILLIFDNLESRYDNLRRAMQRILWTCPEFQVLRLKSERT